MFKNNIEEEVDFCEAYKSQILNKDEEEKSSPLISILIILLLLTIIIALSIFGYNSIVNKQEESISLPLIENIADEELKVTEEVALPVQVKNELQTPEVKPFNALPQSDSVDLDIDDLADKVKIDMSQHEELNDSSKEQKEIEKVSFTLTRDIQSQYVEDLARLTDEIDRESN